MLSLLCLASLVTCAPVNLLDGLGYVNNAFMFNNNIKSIKSLRNLASPSSSVEQIITSTSYDPIPTSSASIQSVEVIVSILALNTVTLISEVHPGVPTSVVTSVVTSMVTSVVTSTVEDDDD